MRGALRSWLPLVLFAAGTTGLGAIAFELLSGAPPQVQPTRARSCQSAPDRIDPTAEVGRERERDPPSPRTLLRQRRRMGRVRFEPLTAAAARRLERRGRAEFPGIVRDPAGRPVAGARIYHDGSPVEVTDDRGRFRAEVVHDVTTRRDDAPLLAVLAPGIGVACEPLWGPSRPLEFTLRPGGALAGRVIDRDSGALVADVTLELLARPDSAGSEQFAFALSTTSDERGRFEFGQLPFGSFELRGRGNGLDSIGFRGFDFAASLGEEIELLVDRTIRVRGRFEPWPPPNAFAEEAELQAWSGASSGRSYDGRTFQAPVDDDGRFELELPDGGRFDLALACGEALLWIDALDAVAQPGDMDFGVIGLPDGAALLARAALPAGALELGVKVRALIECDRGAITVDRELGGDGRLEIAPLPPGRAAFRLLLAGVTIARRGLDEADRFRGATLHLEAGESVDVGEIAAQEGVVCGRVSDGSGSPCANAIVRIGLAGDDGEVGNWVSSGAEQVTDRDGRYCVTTAALDLPDDERARARTLAERLRIAVAARGQAPRVFDVPGLAESGVVRRDLVLAGGSTLYGRLVDAEQQPLVGWTIACRRDSGLLSRPWSRVALDGAVDVTSADGSFEIDGLDGADLEVVAASPDGALFSLPSRRAGPAPVELSLADSLPTDGRASPASAAAPRR